MRRRGKWRKEEDEDKWRDPSTSFPPLLSSLGREVEGGSEGRGKREEKGWIETGRCQEETLKQSLEYLTFSMLAISPQLVIF